MKKEGRFSRFLLDGGFWFDDYIQPVWSINDNEDKNSIVSYLEFKEEYKDICDGLVEFLNQMDEENKQLKEYTNPTYKEHIRLSINHETGELERHSYGKGQWFCDFDRILCKNYISEEDYQKFIDRIIEVYNKEFKK